LKSKNTKQSSEINIVEEAPFITEVPDNCDEGVINFVESDTNLVNNGKNDLVPVKMYFSNTMNDRLGPNDYCIGYERYKKDIKTVLYL
jgi:hypothetical protein